MLSHVTLGTADWPKARPFWIAIMEVLGHPILFERESGIAFGLPTGTKTFVGPAYDGNPPSPGNGVHMAYLAPDRATVDAFYVAALAHGGTDEGPPGLRPHYHPNYYGAYVRDPDGNKLQAVCHSRTG
jgi:catechol 2,3-dioxygenase-like lactoylglutathione lyase family enzyme